MFIIEDNCLQAEDFVRLFASTGWGEIPPDAARTALANSYATFALRCDGRVVAMARLLGDGALAFFLKDVVVDPAWQGRGLGKLLLAHVEAYIRARLKPGWRGYLQLISARGKEGFYLREGYVLHPNDRSGHGMSKWIRPQE